MNVPDELARDLADAREYQLSAIRAIDLGAPIYEFELDLDGQFLKSAKALADWISDNEG